MGGFETVPGSCGDKVVAMANWKPRWRAKGNRGAPSSGTLRQLRWRQPALAVCV